MEHQPKTKESDICAHKFQELKLCDEITQIRDHDLNNFVKQQKKLHLVLDLDHTLLHTSQIKDTVTKGRKSSKSSSAEEFSSGGSVFKFNMQSKVTMMTKLRPYVHTFLKEANQMFQLYIYTMGDKFYASKMAEFLDPQNEYFTPSRIFSHNENTQKHEKSLDLIPAHESTILIIDDNDSVWQLKDRESLILMEEYKFFTPGTRQFSKEMLKSDESETNGALARVLELLRRVYNMYFIEEEENVRESLRMIRTQVLKGCKIVFSSCVFPPRSKMLEAEGHHLWKMAEALGATCATEVDLSVTHVILTNMKRTEESRWAVKENKFLVLPGWIEAANFSWKRPPEDKFSITNN